MKSSYSSNLSDNFKTGKASNFDAPQLLDRIIFCNDRNIKLLTTAPSKWILYQDITAKRLREIILNNPNYTNFLETNPSIRSWTQTKTQRDIWPIIWVTPHCLVHVPDAASEEVTLAVTRETPGTFGSFSRKIASIVWKESMWFFPQLMTIAENLH